MIYVLWKSSIVGKNGIKTVGEESYWEEEKGEKDEFFRCFHITQEDAYYIHTEEVFHKHSKRFEVFLDIFEIIFQDIF